MEEKKKLEDYSVLLNSIVEQINSGKNLYDPFNKLGVIYVEMEDFENAEKYFKLSLSQKPDYIDAILNFGILYNKKMAFKESINFFLKAIELDKTNYRAFYNLGVAYQESGNFLEAVKMYEKSIELNPTFADSHFNKALISLLLGNFNDGWKNYEKWGYISGNRIKRNINGLQWNGENINGKTLFVYSDQAYGDAINFFRYLKPLKDLGANIVFECPDALYSLFSNSKDCFNILINDKSNKKVEFDYYIPLSSLPSVFYFNKLSLDVQFPYLNIKQNILDNWQNQLSGYKGLKIGFLWKGNPYPPINQKRHAKLCDFFPLFEIENTNWFSLAINETEEINSIKNKNVYDLTKYISNFEDTAALISNLDLIVSIDSGVAHLTGALGKKMILLLSIYPDWRWGLDSQIDIYKNVTIFRQIEQNNWNDTIENIRKYILKNIK